MTTPGLIPTGEAADAVGNGVVNEPPMMSPFVPGTAKVEIWLHARAQVDRPEVHARWRGRSTGCRINGFQLPGAIDRAIRQHLIQKCCQGPPVRIDHEAIVLDPEVSNVRSRCPASTSGRDIDNAAGGTIREGRTNQEPIIYPDIRAADSSRRDTVAAGVSLVREQSDELSVRSNQPEP